MTATESKDFWIEFAIFLKVAKESDNAQEVSNMGVDMVKDLIQKNKKIKDLFIRFDPDIIEELNIN